MKFCIPHWEQLKQAVKDRGMYHLVHSSGQAAMDALARVADGISDEKDFDPLMAATMRIYGQFAREAGWEKLDADICPLCEIAETMPDMPDNWIDGCCDEMLEFARESKLMPEVQ